MASANLARFSSFLIVFIVNAFLVFCCQFLFGFDTNGCCIGQFIKERKERECQEIGFWSTGGEDFLFASNSRSEDAEHLHILNGRVALGSCKGSVTWKLIIGWRIGGKVTRWVTVQVYIRAYPNRNPSSPFHSSFSFSSHFLFPIPAAVSSAASSHGIFYHISFSFFFFNFQILLPILMHFLNFFVQYAWKQTQA